MILCDSGVWLALALEGHTHHAAARDWLETVDDPGSVFFCRATQQSLLRLLTNVSVLAAVGSAPLTNRQAWSVYDAFLADDRIVLQAREPAGLERRWRQLAARDTASPKLWMDAYLAAFAIAAGHQLVTTDKAFRQFKGLDVLVLGPASEG